MRRFGGFKLLFVVFGFFALFTLGYTATSVVTSDQAQAQIPSWCFNMSCTSPFTGVAVELGIIMGRTFTTGMFYVVGSLSVYFAVAMASFDLQVIQAISATLNKWLDFWNTMWRYNMEPAFQDMTDQLTTMNTDQARAIGSFADMMDKNRAIRKLREEQVRAHRELSPGENVCVAASTMGGLVQASTFSRTYNALAPQDMLRRQHVGGGSAQADMAGRVARYATRYCDPAENAGITLCPGGPAVPGFIGADLDVAGRVFARDTIDIRDPNVKQAVDDLVQNIAEPFVPDPVPEMSLTGTGGAEAFLQRQSRQAKRQVIYDNLYHIISRRIPGSGLEVGTYVNEVRLEAGMDPALLVNNPSRHEVLEVMANERYRTGKYAVRMMTEPEHVERELAVQEGIKSMQMADMLDLMDRYSLLVAARVGDSINKRYGRVKQGQYQEVGQ
ncbi:MAG: hypothetical protein OXT65_04560 [Alphaproteobacteria bacterium]|nr:hypothetical protein [Alphaproteobacteria bacterium]